MADPTQPMCPRTCVCGAQDLPKTVVVPPVDGLSKSLEIGHEKQYIQLVFNGTMYKV